LSSSPSERGEWSSKTGFILAAAGSAIGLGNIWRFPYTAGENGGAAFLFLYLLCILFIGLPVMIAELSIGRHTRKDPVGAFDSIRPGSAWRLVGFMGVFTGLCILAYYCVIAGVTVGYIAKTLSGNTTSFTDYTANPMVTIPLLLLFIVITVLVVQGGVRNGIERWAKILMPVLFVLMIVLIIRSVTLEGASRGLSFYLKPDFSKITGKTFLAALGQAFFSLSLGMGAMITYGSYLSKRDNIVTSGILVSFFDTLIAVMAGLIIFPALFFAGKNPDAGPGLVFEVLPVIFARLPGGALIGASFFLLLSVAALTSTISLLEVVTAYLVDEKHILRRKAVWIVAAIALVFGLPSALSMGAVEWLGDLPLVGMSFFGFMDWLFGNVMLAAGAVFISVFFGWIWKRAKSTAEIEQGCPGYSAWAPVILFLLRFFCPLAIAIVLFFKFRELIAG
jgi:NSS family neurotransmitter:Na+ symporter